MSHNGLRRAWDEEGGEVRRIILGTAFCLLVALAVPTSASADVLTITDTYGGSNTVWSLNVQTGGCTVCSILLSGFFQDPDGAGPQTNAYTGTYIDSVQFKIDAGLPNPINFLTTNAQTAGLPTWSFAGDASLNANQCSGGGNGNVCGQTNTALGFGPIVNGSTLTWSFNSTFPSPLNTPLGTGNIRAAFNNADGSNFNIFSPNGGTFTSSGTGAGSGTGQNLVPEPTSLLLFGSGLAMTAFRARRKKQQQKDS